MMGRRIGQIFQDADLKPVDKVWIDKSGRSNAQYRDHRQ